MGHSEWRIGCKAANPPVGGENDMNEAKRVFLAVRSVITLAFAISYIVNLFVASPALDNVNLIMMVVVVALNFVGTKGSSRVIGILLFAIGIALLLYSHASFEVWKDAFRENAYLVVLFITIPLLGIPVQKGGYNDSLRGVFDRFANTKSKYYLLVSAMAAIIGTLISIAAVPLSYEVSKTSPHAEDKRVLGTALSRGFITCMIWAPTSATIALVVSVTGIDWMEFFPVALLCAIAAEAVGVVMTAVRERGAKSVGATSASADELNVVKVVELGAFSVALIAVIAAISQFAELSVIIVVAIVSLFFPVMWMAIIKKLPTYVQEFKTTYFNGKLPKANNQIVLFSGAGLFAASISASHVGDIIAGALLTVTGQSVLLLTIAIIIVTLATSAVGMHPIAVIAVFGGIISAADIGVSPIYLALVYSISWALGNSICPASANVIAVSGLVGASPIKASLRWNVPYALVSVVVLVSLLTALRAVGVL